MCLYYFCEEANILCFFDYKLIEYFWKKIWKCESKDLDSCILIDPEIIPVKICQTEVTIITLKDLAIKRVIAFLFAM